MGQRKPRGTCGILRAVINLGSVLIKSNRLQGKEKVPHTMAWGILLSWLLPLMCPEAMPLLGILHTNSQPSTALSSPWPLWDAL